MRLFIAIDLPADLQEGMSRAAELLKRGLREGGIRWARPEGRHLTLKFLGEVDSSRLDQASRGMEQAAAHHAPFRIDLSGCGVFPNPRRPRVLWVGVENPDGELARLQAAIEDRLAELGFERERRPFHPHVTLGRVRRNVRGREVRELGERLGQIVIHPLGGTEVSEIYLIRSELKPTGAEYTRMATAGLERERDGG